MTKQNPREPMPYSIDEAVVLGNTLGNLAALTGLDHDTTLEVAYTLTRDDMDEPALAYLAGWLRGASGGAQRVTGFTNAILSAMAKDNPEVCAAAARAMMEAALSMAATMKAEGPSYTARFSGVPSITDERQARVFIRSIARHWRDAVAIMLREQKGGTHTASQAAKEQAKAARPPAPDLSNLI